jgi:uncharacterized repeat protein (TIGR03803 family)
MVATALLFAASTAFSQTVKTVANFSAAPDASIVTGAALALDGKGNIFGTTVDGGAHGNGCIYRVTPGGKATTLYSFGSSSDGTNSDGANPHGGLIAGSDGSFYGTTYVGGANGTGTVFQVSTPFRMAPTGPIRRRAWSSARTRTYTE